MNTVNLILVFFGAGFGGAARYSLGCVLAQPSWLPFPIATLAVNLTGAFLAGLVFASFGSVGLKNNPVGVFLMTGLLGGFTTFSAFTLEGANLLLDKPFLALAHAAVHVLGCFCAFFVGNKLLMH